MLTTKELSKELGLAASTIRGYALEGMIPFETTPGGHRRYDLEDVREALGRVRARKLEPLRQNEEPRLASGSPASFARARGWRPSITPAMLMEDRPPESAPERHLRVPMLGVPGSSQFTVRHGVRA